jgi:pyrroline-5-carboxylate reductase
MKIGFLGAGKMARALAAGIVRANLVDPTNITCSSRSENSSRLFLSLTPGAHWTDDLVELVRGSDLAILAIKPQQMPEVLPPLREASAGKLVLSLAAGITLAQMTGWLSPTARVVRAMPNVPLQAGQGASVYAPGPGVTAADLDLVCRVLGSAGKSWHVEEKQIDAITALSGSGPAYVFHFIEALVRGAVALGLDEKLARELAIQTVVGSAELAARTTLSPMELAAQVKSPGGTTLAGCAVLEDKDALNDLMARCLAAAKARAEALARGEA